MASIKPNIAELENILNTATTHLPKVTSKKMFGCHALWADGNVFALVWKHGRIGVKLPEATQYKKLMDTSGAEPWKAGPMQMAHWVKMDGTSPRSLLKTGKEDQEDHRGKV